MLKLVTNSFLTTPSKSTMVQTSFQFNTILLNVWKLVSLSSCSTVKSVPRLSKLSATLLFVFALKMTVSLWAARVSTFLTLTSVAMSLLKKIWLTSNLVPLAILTLSPWASFRVQKMSKNFAKSSFLTVQPHKSLQKSRLKKLSKLMKNLKPSLRLPMPLWSPVVIWQLRLVTKLSLSCSAN